MPKFFVAGKVELNVSKIVEAANEEEAIRKAHEMLDNLNADIREVELARIDDNTVQVNVDDWNITWNHVNEADEDETALV
jgi:alpha-L-arabinofuranosidase